MNAVTRVPDEVKWKNCGRQLGREKACLDLARNTQQDPATMPLDPGCHPAWIAGVREGYAETIAAKDPLQVAMGGNE